MNEQKSEESLNDTDEAGNGWIVAWPKRLSHAACQHEAMAFVERVIASELVDALDPVAWHLANCDERECADSLYKACRTKTELRAELLDRGQPPATEAEGRALRGARSAWQHALGVANVREDLVAAAEFLVRLGQIYSVEGRGEQAWSTLDLAMTTLAEAREAQAASGRSDAEAAIRELEAVCRAAIAQADSRASQRPAIAHPGSVHSPAAARDVGRIARAAWSELGRTLDGLPAVWQRYAPVQMALADRDLGSSTVGALVRGTGRIVPFDVRSLALRPPNRLVCQLRVDSAAARLLPKAPYDLGLIHVAVGEPGSSVPIAQRFTITPELASNLVKGDSIELDIELPLAIEGELHAIGGELPPDAIALVIGGEDGAPQRQGPQPWDAHADVRAAATTSLPTAASASARQHVSISAYLDCIATSYDRSMLVAAEDERALQINVWRSDGRRLALEVVDIHHPSSDADQLVMDVTLDRRLLDTLSEGEGLSFESVQAASGTVTAARLAASGGPATGRLTLECTRAPIATLAQLDSLQFELLANFDTAFRALFAFRASRRD